MAKGSWIPFDPNNPVYAKLEKETAFNRQTWRIVGSIAVLMVIADQMGKRGLWAKGKKVTGMGAHRYNPYGIIRK